MTDPVAARAADRPDAIAIFDASTDEAWTFAVYDDRVDATASRLAALDVGAGDRVAILSETRPAVARVLFACWRLGAVLVPLNARLGHAELREQLATIDPSLLLVAPPQHEAGVAANGMDVPVRRVDGSDGDTPTPRLSDVSPDSYEPATVAPGDDVVALFTSGTTGDPKAVRLTAGTFAAAATAHRERFGAEPTDRWLCPLSTYHMGGLAIVVRSAFYGTTAVLQRTDEAFDPARTRRALDEHDCTATSVVPIMLRRLLEDGPLPSSLRFVLSGGAPTPTALVERAVDLGVPVCPTYGMTETTSQVATATPETARTHPETVGRPLPGVSVTLLDDDGEPVRTGEVGEIVVSGRTVTPGYVDGGGSFDEHGFHTGDRGRFDDDGRLTVLDRREDRIVTGGENVHPAEVAAVVADHPSVADVVVVGLPDPEWGEQVAALVVPTDGVDPDAERIRAATRERLAGYKVPRTVAFADELPRTTSGTVDRAAARDAIRRLTDR